GRKFHLFACGCVRLGWVQLPAVSRAALLLGEDLVEGVKIDPDERIRIEWQARSIKGKEVNAYSEVAYQLCDYDPDISYYAATQTYEPDTEIPERIRLQVARDLFPNPLHPVQLRPEWVTATVRDLAQQMYDSHDFA